MGAESRARRVSNFKYQSGHCANEDDERCHMWFLCSDFKKCWSLFGGRRRDETTDKD